MYSQEGIETMAKTYKRGIAMIKGARLKFGLRNKLILSFAAVLLIPSLIIGFAAYNNAKNVVEAEVEVGVTHTINVLNSTISQYVESEMRDVDYLAHRISASSIEGNDASLRSDMDSFSSRHPELESVILVTQSGVWMQFPQSVQKLDPRTNDWYKQAMSNKGHVVISDPHESTTTHNVVVTIAETTADGKGAIGVNLNLKSLADMTKQVKIGKTGYVFILDQHKNILIHPTTKPGTPAQNKERFTGSSGAVTWVQNGVPKRNIYTTNSLTGWMIVSTMTMSELAAEANPILYKMLIVIVVALILIGSALYFIIRSIIIPIQRLVNVADKISEGDLTKRVEIKHHDEIGQLGLSFNKMTDVLHKQVTDVSNTVQLLAASAEQLAASADENSKATEQITTAIQEVASSSDTQAKRADESAKIVEDMAIRMQSIASAIMAVSDSASSANDTAVAGNLSIEKTAHQMSSIRDHMDELASIVRELGERSTEIGQIVDVITEISSQTNLLALNAAIEAARAGESGRGFAVVAGEVRKLAERSSEAARQIDDLIARIQSDVTRANQSAQLSTAQVAEGLAAMARTSESFENIRASVEAVTKQAVNMSDAAEYLSTAAEQLRLAIEGVAKGIEATASGVQTVSAATEEQLASMQEIAASATSLSRIAEQLQKTVDQFKV
jgi:methyl-accepting chemotaxis protein